MGAKVKIRVPGMFDNVPIFGVGSFKKSDYEVELSAVCNKFYSEDRIGERFRDKFRYEPEKLKGFSLKRLVEERKQLRFQGFRNKVIKGFSSSEDSEAVEFSSFRPGQKVMILKLLLIHEKRISNTREARENQKKEKALAALSTWDAVWAKSNWGRLLISRTINLCYAFAQHPPFIQSATFSTMNALFSQVSMFLAPLSYSMYLLRICTVLAPYLIQASLNGGADGLNAALWEKSQGLASNILWFVLGVTSAILSAVGLPMVSMVLVCTLYLFNVLNTVCHDFRDKQHHKKKQKDLARKINNDIEGEEFLDMALLFPVLKRMLRNSPESCLLASFTINLCKATTQDSVAKGITELKKIGPDFTEDQAKRLLLYTQDKIKEQAMLATQYAIPGGHIPFALIEVSCLMTGLIGTTVGTGLVLAGMGAPLLTTASIIPLIVAACAAVTLTSVIGLSLITVGAVVILTICAVRLTKEIIEAVKKPQNEKRQQRSVLRAAEYSQLGERPKPSY